MQKIMFNNTYGLTKAVLNGKKTMTRRVIKDVSIIQHLNELEEDDKIHTQNADIEIIKVKIARYKLGEVVAVAQAYKDIEEYNPESYEDVMLDQGTICESSHPYSHLMRSGGWDNKMFVRPDLMPHQIQITDIKVERLQDISDEDCIKEGIIIDTHRGVLDDNIYMFEVEGKHYCQWHFPNPREAFAALINRPGVGRKGLWESNPWVICYSFKLVK